MSNRFHPPTHGPLIVATWLLVACGGGGRPAGPSAATPISTRAVQVQAVDGHDSRPVDATVTTVADGRTYASGEPITLSTGARLNFEAPGFLLRETIYRAEPRFALWSTSVTSADYIQTLVYNEFVPRRMLSRQRPGTVGVAPSEEVRINARAMAALSAAIDELNRVMHGFVRFALDSSSQVQFRVVFHAEATPPGSIAVRYEGNYIVGGEVRISGRETDEVFDAAILYMHELGHGLGLGHSPAQFPEDIMCPGLGSRFVRSRRPQSFSEREVRIIEMMMQRFPGTSWPDNDTAAQATARGVTSTVVIHCQSRSDY